MQYVLSGAGGGAAGGAMSGAIYGGMTEDGWSWEGAGRGALQGAAQGAIGGALMGGVGYGIDKASGRLNPTSHRETVKRAAPGEESHHVIQDAAMKNVPGYSREDAPAIPLTAEQHRLATAYQRQPGGGTYGQERGIGYGALRTTMSGRAATIEILIADHYFGSIGVGVDTPTSIPGSRSYR